ncbi:Solute carrier family 40 member 1 [Hondaea fermentalgiana]|uniref:Solute carrier family 40 member 1 n=1 Tax=Hondaea fermentalgiana TaxID=2315210 RepID=A0A2R5H0J9_9STRA|nr:Solute carrier family 40 member 1 [Hondaea fermentalgiana]|eukprot:GBG34583.1 Solute carrier family 40 member 1 [Hondaea fermentalgiana]
MPGCAGFGQSRAARQLETLALVLATLLCATLLGLVTPCLLLTVQDLSDVVDSEICLVRGSWIGACLFIGTLGLGPCIMVLRERLRARPNGAKTSRAPQTMSGYVRPSIYKQFRPAVDPYTCARRALRIAQFVSSSCAATTDLTLAVVLIAVFSDSLEPAAAIVLCSTLMTSLLVHRVVPKLMQVDRLTCALALVLLERISALTAIALAFRLAQVAFPEASAIVHGPVALLQNAKVSKTHIDGASSAGADASPPSSGATEAAGAGAGPSSVLGIDSGAVAPWVFEKGSSGNADPEVDAALSASQPEVWQLQQLMLLCVLIFAFSLSVVARAARNALIRKDWSKLVASAPFSMTQAMPFLTSSSNEQSRPSANKITARLDLAMRHGSEASSRMSPLGSFAESEDSSEGIGGGLFGSGSMESPIVEEKLEAVEIAGVHGRAVTGDGLHHEPEVVYGRMSESVMARDCIDASVLALKVSLSRAHTIAFVCAPTLFGLVVDLGEPRVALFIAMETLMAWQILVLMLEMSCFRLAYHTEAALRTERPPLDTSVTFFDPYGSRSIYHPIGVSPRRPTLERAKRSLKRWRVYARSPVFLASLAYAALGVSILDLGILSLTYLRWRRLPVWIIGVLIGLRCFSCGLVSFVKYIHRWTGSLARTASLTLWVLWSTTFPAILGFTLFGSSSKASLLFLMVVLIFSGPPLRAFALVHAKLLREWVEEEQVPTVLECQSALRTFGTIAMSIMALILGNAQLYGALVIISVAASLFSVVLFALWFRIYDSGTPFQVVDHAGHVKVVVHG